MILEENPDVILLLELWDISRHSGLKDQFGRLLKDVGEGYPYYCRGDIIV